MGEAARRVFRERTTAAERVDIGLQMADEAVERLIATIEVPEGLSGEERARFLVKAIRAREE